MYKWEGANLWIPQFLELYELVDPIALLLDGECSDAYAIPANCVGVNIP